MKKILIFSLSYYPSHVGGAEVALKQITDRIPAQEIEFHLLCNRYDSMLPKEERVGTVFVHRIGFARRGADVAMTHRPFFYLAKILFVPLAALRAWSLHRTHRFDGFWAMMVYMTLPIRLLRLVGVRLPYALTLQEGDPFAHVFARPHIRLVLPLLRRGIRDATVVQAISTFLGGWARTMGFTGRPEIIPNGVPIAEFSRGIAPAERARMRAAWGCGERDTVLIHIGRMVEKNGIPDIIRALSHLPASVSFVQVGSGPDEEVLREFSRTCGVADRVRFVGFVAHEDLPRYLHSSDIFVRPSLSEGMGISFVEAFAAGVPVIGTAVGGITDFLFDPSDCAGRADCAPTGRVVAARDSEAIARAVTAYQEDVTLTRRIVDNARALAAAQYDWERIVRDMRARVFSLITDA